MKIKNKLHKLICINSTLHELRVVFLRPWMVKFAKTDHFLGFVSIKHTNIQTNHFNYLHERQTKVDIDGIIFVRHRSCEFLVGPVVEDVVDESLFVKASLGAWKTKK